MRGVELLRVHGHGYDDQFLMAPGWAHVCRGGQISNVVNMDRYGRTG